MAPASPSAPNPRDAERLRSVRVALGVAIALFAAKMAVFLATGLLVVLAEALHSLTDALQTLFLLFAARLSARPADANHPFGHGRGENLAAVLISLVFVTVVALELFREAAGALTSPHRAPSQPALALVVLGGSAILLLWPLILARRDMHDHGGVVRAQAVESLNDLLGILAAIGGTALVMLGIPAADGVAALIVGLIIVYNAIALFRENVPYLVGGSPPHNFYRSVEAVALRVEGVVGVHSMAAEYIGPNQVHLDMHLTVRANMTIEDADKLAHRVRDRLEAELNLHQVTIHFCASKGELRRIGKDVEGRAARSK